MLHAQTVLPSTLEILKNLNKIPILKNFYLVGGTNLALRYGHRFSIDLDLFTNQPFDTRKIFKNVKQVIPNAKLIRENDLTMRFDVNDVKVDVIAHEYEHLIAPEIIDGINMASIPDVIAMKLNAIARRGAKKDFWDVAELLNHYSLAQMIDFLKKKYEIEEYLYILRALVYFADAQDQEEPDCYKKITWTQVKSKIKKAVREHLESLS